MTVAEKSARAVKIGFIVFHLACLGAIFTGVSPVAFWVMLGFYIIRAFGVTAGYHRLLAHNSFQAGRGTQFGLTLLGSLAVQGGPLWWVSHHRNHHRYTEKPEDIHSPSQHGFWRSHMGWMMDKECFEGRATNVKKLHQFPEIKFLQRHYLAIVISQAVFMFLLGYGLNLWKPELGTSGLQMLVWGFFISTVALWHATFMVNSVCHIWGSKKYSGENDSTNNWIVATLTLGEGWHNNHHQYAYSARHGLQWWQLDVTWLVLRAMETMGLVSALRIPARYRKQPAAS